MGRKALFTRSWFSPEAGESETGSSPIERVEIAADPVQRGAHLWRIIKRTAGRAGLEFAGTKLTLHFAHDVA